MRFTVDLTQCQNLGQCERTAPSLFSMDDEGMLVFRSEAEDRYVSGELTGDQVDSASAASDTCPMQAISLLERSAG
jgi:ferredoxin